MGITDFSTNEVRIRQGSEFTAIPNFQTAGETLADGQFVYRATEGTVLKAGQDTRATHLVLKSGEARKTATEIATLIGTVVSGEPVLAITGTGTVTIPFGYDVTEGQELTVDSNGYATPWSTDESDVSPTGAYVVGRALENITADADGNRWGIALITLPAQYSPTRGA